MHATKPVRLEAPVVLDGVAILPISIFQRQKKDDGSVLLVAELAELSDYFEHATGAQIHRQPSGQIRCFRPPRVFTIHGDSADVTFQLSGVDDNHGEVAGWRYKTTQNTRLRCEVLVIND